MHPVEIVRSVLRILGGAILAGLLAGAAHGTGGLVLVIWLLWGVLFVWQGSRIAIWWRRYFVVTENRLMLVTDHRLHPACWGEVIGVGTYFACQPGGATGTASTTRAARSDEARAARGSRRRLQPL